MESVLVENLYSPNARHSKEEEECMIIDLGNGLYRFILSVRVEGLETPRRRVYTERCAGPAKAEEMAVILKERARKEISRSLTSQVETVGDAIKAYRLANPNAKWGDDRYKVALDWAGSLKLDKDVVREFSNIVEIFKTTDTKFKSWPAASTVNKLISLCKTGVRYCALNFMIDRNWLEGVKKVPEHNERAVYVWPEMLEKIIACLPDTPNAWRDLVRCAYFTGMRQGELRDLRMEQVDIFARRITLIITKSKRPRKVPIADEIMPYFVSRQGQEWAFEIGGGPLEKRQVCQAWQRAAAKAELPEVHLHDLRGTFGTDLIESGVPEKVVMDIMGHYSRASFLRYQKHKHDCQLDDALKARRTGHYETTKTTTKLEKVG